MWIDPHTLVSFGRPAIDLMQHVVRALLVIRVQLIGRSPGPVVSGTSRAHSSQGVPTVHDFRRSLLRLQKNGLEVPDIKCCRAEDMPYENDFFDLIYCF